MKVIWSEQDIKPGQIYGKRTIQERWIIGFIPWIDGDKKYTSTSLSDGQVNSTQTKSEVANDLTESEYLPLELL